MKYNWDRETIVRTLVSVAVIVVLYLLIRRLSGVLLPFLVSFVIAYILAPIVDFFQHKCRLKNRVLSVVVTLLISLGVIAGIVALLTPAISRQMVTLSHSAAEYARTFDASQYLSPRMNEQMKEWISNLDIRTLAANPDVQQAVKSLVPKLGTWISSGLSSLAGLAVVFISLLYIIFLLIDYEKIRQNWADYIPARYRKGVQTLMSDLDRNMNGYFRGQALIAACVGVLFAIGFQLIGLPMGIAMGLIVGVLNLIPYMQALGIPPCILLGLIQSAETGRPVWVVMLCIAAVFVVVQSIQDLLLTPKIMGNVTGMGPAAILLCLSVWGSLLGIVGMIIALPMTTLIISYYKRFVLHLAPDAVADTTAHAASAEVVETTETADGHSPKADEAVDSSPANDL
ncbi:MAG: AI-2E family transporter [Paludibacteraceae bacterium]